MSDYEEEKEREQIVILEEFLDGISGPHFSGDEEKFLSDAFYTLEENGRMDYRIDEELIPVIWKLFHAMENLSSVELNRLRYKIRM